MSERRQSHRKIPGGNYFFLVSKSAPPAAARITATPIHAGSPVTGLLAGVPAISADAVVVTAAAVSSLPAPEEETEFESDEVSDTVVSIPEGTLEKAVCVPLSVKAEVPDVDPAGETVVEAESEDAAAEEGAAAVVAAEVDTVVAGTAEVVAEPSAVVTGADAVVAGMDVSVVSGAEADVGTAVAEGTVVSVVSVKSEAVGT